MFTVTLLSLAACGQIGKLYLYFPPSTLPPVVTTTFAPAVALKAPLSGTIAPPAVATVMPPPVSTVQPALPTSEGPPAL